VHGGNLQEFNAPNSLARTRWFFGWSSAFNKYFT
jgi:hypothetical protein